jgi:hypothetical protein
LVNVPDFPDQALSLFRVRSKALRPLSKKVRELFGPPAKLAFAPPNPEMVKAAILMSHAQVKAAREKEAAKKGKAKGAASQTLQLQMP